MSSKNQKVIVFLTTLIDLSLVSLAWIVAFYIRFYSFVPISKGIPNFELYLKLVPFVVIIWLTVLTASGFYKRTRLRRSAVIEGIDILQNCVLATLAFIAVTFFYHEYRYSRLNLVIFTFLHPIFLLVGRSFIRKALRFYKKRSPKRKVLIIGSGENIENACTIIQDSYIEEIAVTGAIVIGANKDQVLAKKICKRKNITIFPLPEKWTTFFIKNPCESVIIALPHQYHDFLDNHLAQIAEQVTNIKMLPDLNRFTKFGAGVDIVKKHPVISIHESPLQGLEVIGKRVVDFFGAILSLMIFGPLMLIIAGVIKLSSKGPILFRQDRMGLDGHVFSIYKFRSMPLNVENTTGAVWAKSGENRATKFGSFLRKTSLDELPQLLNVLSGDMSLVGPRPERPVFVNQFRHDVPGYMLRHKVKAGMTGWAQVNGWRGNTSIDKRIECDLYYIQNWSLWLDIKILFLTVLRGFIHPNAY
ncbi:MAG: undecaprenyl-phosphate glucose phosphotransferase [Oligoflexales bacterium]|nr:undecaprenyl-phosphate glucose phosphotransferase [Oligoflexales bacterium]